MADVHDTAARRLHAVGQRYTTGRQAVVDVLAAARAPLTIPEVVAGGRPIPQSSAYRNLAVLEEARVVRRILTSGDFARYELAEDLTEHHHHLICSACGMPCVAVTCGGISEAELREAGAAAVYRDPEDLVARLDDSPLGELLR